MLGECCVPQYLGRERGEKRVVWSAAGISVPLRTCSELVLLPLAPPPQKKGLCFAFMPTQALGSLLTCPKQNRLEWWTPTQASAEADFRIARRHMPNTWTLRQVFKNRDVWFVAQISLWICPGGRWHSDHFQRTGAVCGCCLCYIKTWNTAKRAKVTAEDKALNVGRTEQVTLCYGEPIPVTVPCQM